MKLETILQWGHTSYNGKLSQWGHNGYLIVLHATSIMYYHNIGVKELSQPYIFIFI